MWGKYANAFMIGVVDEKTYAPGFTVRVRSSITCPVPAP